MFLCKCDILEMLIIFFKEFFMNLACIYLKKRGWGHKARGFSLFEKVPFALFLALALLLSGCNIMKQLLGEEEVEEAVPSALSIATADGDLSAEPGGTLTFTVKLDGAAVTPDSVAVNRRGSAKSMSTGINVDPDTGVLTLVVAENEPVGYKALTVTAVHEGKTAAVPVTVHTPEKYFNDNYIAYSNPPPKGTTWLHNYSGEATDIVIPSKINGETVTVISPQSGALSFSDKACVILTSVSIPDSVTVIGPYAFWGDNLSSIIIPDSVVSIGADLGMGPRPVGGTFKDNVNLKSATLPNSLTTIEESTFENTGLISVDIPHSVTTIGASAFKGTTALKNIDIPHSVTTIGASAFKGSVLESISIPDSVTAIEESVFQSTTALTSITIPDSVKTIGKTAFMGTGLTSITIPDSVTSIGDRAFMNAKFLTDVTIGANVETIGNNAFQGTTALTSVTIGAKVTTITGTQAFGDVNKTAAFKTAYTSADGGAGTYVYNDSDSTWTKQ
jgi:hypothetical protein